MKDSTSRNNTQLCAYYQAILHKPDIWFVVACLKGFDHLAFDRAFDVEKDLFEFFVPQAGQPLFLELMGEFEKQGLVRNLIQLPNRLRDASQDV